MTKKNSILILLLAFFISNKSFAQEYYVDPLNGQDNNEGSYQNPFKTIKNAVQFVNNITGQGFIKVKLMPGVYVLDDKVCINPIRILNDTCRFIIEAFIMPGDSNWSPEKMPVIQSFSGDNSNNQFPHSAGFLVASNNVTIRGLKFLGNANPEVPSYYPITREDESLKDLEVSQCYFIAEKNSSSIQGGIWAHGETININHCIFYCCRNAILLFKNINKSSITHNIIYGAYQSAFWIGEDPNLTFSNNVISNCDYTWIGTFNSKIKYKFNNSIVTDNKYYIAWWNYEKAKVEAIKETNIIETNVIKNGKVKLIERNSKDYPLNYLHLGPESVGYDLNAGIHMKKL